MDRMRIFVSPHAVHAYQVRVKALPAERAEAEIVAALEAPLFRVPSADGRLTIWGCCNPAGFPVCIATDPADYGAAFLLVRTCGPFWFWHEARREWRRVRGHKARRRSRRAYDRLSAAATLR